MARWDSHTIAEAVRRVAATTKGAALYSELKALGWCWGGTRESIDRLIAYKRRMGWEFPYVSTYNTDFPFDFGLAVTPEQAREIPELQAMLADPPDWLVEWSEQVGAKLRPLRSS